MTLKQQRQYHNSSTIKVQHCGQVADVEDSEFTGLEFESMLAPILNNVRDLEEFALKFKCTGSTSNTNGCELSWG